MKYTAVPFQQKKGRRIDIANGRAARPELMDSPATASQVKFMMKKWGWPAGRQAVLYT